MSKTREVRGQVDHWARCSTDLEYYNRHNLKIKTKQGQIIPLRFRRAQQIWHAKTSAQWKEKGYVKQIVLKARQEGISTGVASRFFRRAHLTAFQKIMVMADQLDHSENIWDMYDLFNKGLPEEARPGPPGHYADGELITLGNGSEIVTDTAGDKTGGRSATAQCLHASEVAFWMYASDVMTGLLQVIPDVGCEVIMESTANGVGGYFYDQWKRAEEGASDFVPIFLPWWIHEEYSIECDEDERQDILASDEEFERRALDEGIRLEGALHKLTVEQLAWRRHCIANKCDGDLRKFKQEYPSTADEAFLVSGNCFFEEEHLLRYEETTRERITVFRGNLREAGDRIIPSAAPRGFLKIWVPPRVGGSYVIGVDTALGKKVAAEKRTFDDPEGERGGRDFNCADVIEVASMTQVAQLHCRISPEEMATQLNMLGRMYGSDAPGGLRLPALLGVERNHESSAGKILRDLREKYDYPALYYSRQVNRRTNKVTPILGWRTSAETRKIMLDDLAALIRSESIDINCLETIKEMTTFVIADDGKPEAQEECHDDRVMSIAIAIQVARSVAHQSTEEPMAEIEILDTPTGLFDYGWDD